MEAEKEGAQRETCIVNTASCGGEDPFGKPK